MVTPKSAAPQRPKPARGEAFGILNPYGDLWTHQTFEREDHARQYVKDYWSQPCFRAVDTSKFKVIPVRVTVSAKAEPSPSIRGVVRRGTEP